MKVHGGREKEGWILLYYWIESNELAEAEYKVFYKSVGEETSHYLLEDYLGNCLEIPEAFAKSFAISVVETMK